MSGLVGRPFRAASRPPAPVGPPSEDVAGLEEVAALGVLLSRTAHVPKPRADEDDEDDEVLAGLDPAADSEATPPLLPCQQDEFTCVRCFLVTHVSRRVPDTNACRDCG